MMGSSSSTIQGEPGRGQRSFLSSSSSGLVRDRSRSRSPDNEGSRDPNRGRRRAQSFRSAVAQLYPNNTHEVGRRLIPSAVHAARSSVTQTSENSGSEHEQRPLMDTGERPEDNGVPFDVGWHNLIRRRSRVSRLGSRLLPDTVVRNLLSSGEETEAEGRALRHDYHNRERPTAWEGRAPSSGARFSLRDSIRQRSSRADPRRQTIRGPFPIGDTGHQLLPESPEPGPRTGESESRELPDVGSYQQRAGLRRIRHSLPTPLQSLFNRPNEPLVQAPTSRNTSNRVGGLPTAEDSDHLLPPHSGADRRSDHEDVPHELDAVEPETRNLLSSSRITQGMSTIRRFPHGLRSRSTRLVRRSEHPPLSQVLQLAAAAIAAQLSGHAHSGMTGSRPFAGETFDGSIQNFVQTLQEAASAQAGENIDLNAADGDLPPVNFMRVFQFPNDENGAPITSQGPSANSESVDVETLTRASDGDRSVTLVLVGVRSMPHTLEGSGNENGTIGPSLDTLLSLPFLPPTNVLRNGSSGALFRRGDHRMRQSTRRHSMTNFNAPAQVENSRRQRVLHSATDASTEMAPTTDSSLQPNGSSESPPGPNPPPSTPADMRSGNATPTRRPSSASAVNLSEISEPLAQPQPSTTSTSSGDAFATPRQRRRSDSEFSRRPELGSGAARRNGVVEPDHPPTGAGRSWLIYVVGTNVSSDHPAFTMPSLFTDNPSYEDMQMLSTLLGPVKPPVATQEDVTSAGGVFRLKLLDSELVGESVADGMAENLLAIHDERCLICLSDYEPSEEIRKLDKCQHIFHRECIDEVRLRFLSLELYDEDANNDITVAHNGPE